MTKEDIIEMANLLWKAKEHAVHVGIGNPGELIATIKYVLHKNFLYDMKKRTFVLKEDKAKK